MVVIEEKESNLYEKSENRLQSVSLTIPLSTRVECDVFVDWIR